MNEHIWTVLALEGVDTRAEATDKWEEMWVVNCSALGIEFYYKCPERTVGGTRWHHTEISPRTYASPLHYGKPSPALAAALPPDTPMRLR